MLFAGTAIPFTGKKKTKKKNGGLNMKHKILNHFNISYSNLSSFKLELVKLLWNDTNFYVTPSMCARVCVYTCNPAKTVQHSEIFIRSINLKVFYILENKARLEVDYNFAESKFMLNIIFQLSCTTVTI